MWADAGRVGSKSLAGWTNTVSFGISIIAQSFPSMTEAATSAPFEATVPRYVRCGGSGASSNLPLPRSRSIFALAARSDVRKRRRTSGCPAMGTVISSSSGMPAGTSSVTASNRTRSGMLRRVAVGRAVRAAAGAAAGTDGAFAPPFGGADSEACARAHIGASPTSRLVARTDRMRFVMVVSESALAKGLARTFNPTRRG